jgi:streptogramin lyase
MTMESLNAGETSLTDVTGEIPNLYDGSGSAMKVNSPGQYAGVKFTPPVNRTMATGQSYKVTFSYKVLANPNGSTLYIQLGGGAAATVNTTAGHEERTVKTLVCVSNMLQIFSSASGIVFTLDDIQIEKVAATMGVNATSEQFETITPNIAYAAFNGGLIEKTTDWSLLPNAGSGNAMKVSCPALYSGIILAPPAGKALVTGQSYKVTFSYKILENPNGSTIYVDLGGGAASTINTTVNYSTTVTLTLTDVSNVIRMFSSATGIVLTYDDIQIEPA